MSPADVAIAFVTGAVAGAFAGLLGIGGGLLMVPAMVVLLDQSQLVAAGTSLLVIVPTALVGMIATRRRGLPEPSTAVLLGAGGLAGASAGALLALKVFGEPTLRRLFGIFVVAGAIRLLVAPRREREEPGIPPGPDIPEP